MTIEALLMENNANKNQKIFKPTDVQTFSLKTNRSNKKTNKIIKAVRKISKFLVIIFLYSLQMSNHKCQTKNHSNYEVKQRYIPTFTHEQIFQEAPLRPCSSRCTPTFHSTVFDTEGYNIKTVHSKNITSLV